MFVDQNTENVVVPLNSAHPSIPGKLELANSWVSISFFSFDSDFFDAKFGYEGSLSELAVLGVYHLFSLVGEKNLNLNFCSLNTECLGRDRIYCRFGKHRS